MIWLFVFAAEIIAIETVIWYSLKAGWAYIQWAVRRAVSKS